MNIANAVPGESVKLLADDTNLFLSCKDVDTLLLRAEVVA